MIFEIDPRLSRLAYRCHPDGCPRDRTCCIGLAVAVSRREMRVIDSLMDELARLVPALREDDGEFVDVFGEEDGAWQLEPVDEDGTCPFLFRRRRHSLCAIHALALTSGREVADVKPRACRHWPLALERRGRRIRLTIHEEALAIGCVAAIEELPGQPSVREAFATEIRELEHEILGD